MSISPICIGPLTFLLSTLLESLPFEPTPLLDKRAFVSVQLELPRIALVETFFHDMDAGWTRYIFDSYKIPFTVLNPGDFKDKKRKGSKTRLLY